VIKFKKQIAIFFVAISPCKIPKTKSVWSCICEIYLQR